MYDTIEKGNDPSFGEYRKFLTVIEKRLNQSFREGKIESCVAAKSKSPIKTHLCDIDNVFTRLLGNYHGRLSISASLVLQRVRMSDLVSPRNARIAYHDGKLRYTADVSIRTNIHVAAGVYVFI